MNDKRQNNQKEIRSIYDPQLRLAFALGAAGEAQSTADGRVESLFSPHEHQSPTIPLTTRVVEGMSLTNRTAVYGPVRTVVWEGSGREAAPYPDCAPTHRSQPETDSTYSSRTHRGLPLRDTRHVLMLHLTTSGIIVGE
jgi:hypothetical protein